MSEKKMVTDKLKCGLSAVNNLCFHRNYDIRELAKTAKAAIEDLQQEVGDYDLDRKQRPNETVEQWASRRLGPDFIVGDC